MMMLMMMMMNCFCGMVDRRMAFSLISTRDRCQRSSQSRIYNTPQTLISMPLFQCEDLKVRRLSEALSLLEEIR